MAATELDKVVNLCKRRGFVFPSAEIYGGFRSTYDYGPLGVLMLRNVRTPGGARWCSCATTSSASTPPSSSPPAVWEASGHLANFTDPLVDCTNCKERFRLDKLDDPEHLPELRRARTRFTEARQFNLMFKTHAGPVEDAGAEAYLRPETAQGMFVNFNNVLQTSPQEAAVRHRPGRQVVPQRDHAAATSSSAPASSSRWRWSTSCRPAEAPQWYEYWCAERLALVHRPRHPRRPCCACAPHDADELSHYSSGTSDVEFLFPWGWDELEGIANRGDYDLTQHAEALGRAARVLRPGHRTSATCPT